MQPPLARALLAELIGTFALVFAGAALAYQFGVRRLNWHLPDPKGLPLEHVRPIRDEIKRLVCELVDELDQAATAAG